MPSSITTAAEATGIQRKKGFPLGAAGQQVLGIDHQDTDRHQHQCQAQAERYQKNQAQAHAPQ